MNAVKNKFIKKKKQIQTTSKKFVEEDEIDEDSLE